jgi:hypothetical protein
VIHGGLDELLCGMSSLMEVGLEMELLKVDLSMFLQDVPNRCFHWGGGVLTSPDVAD